MDRIFLANSLSTLAHSSSLSQKSWLCHPVISHNIPRWNAKQGSPLGVNPSDIDPEGRLWAAFINIIIMVHWYRCTTYHGCQLHKESSTYSIPKEMMATTTTRASRRLKALRQKEPLCNIRPYAIICTPTVSHNTINTIQYNRLHLTMHRTISLTD